MVFISRLEILGIERWRLIRYAFDVHIQIETPDLELGPDLAPEK